MTNAWSDWLGRSTSQADRLSAWPSQAFEASFHPEREEELDRLPPLRHWLHFLHADRIDALGQDGHAAKGGFLPPVDLPRRMWAGGRLKWHGPMAIGAAHTKRSSVQSIIAKKGRSGPLVFVEVLHEIAADDGGLCLTEIHDIVYRQSASSAPPPASQQPLQAFEFEQSVAVNEVQLFRYSALTFNSHRIHYDADYVRDVESYPGLVVHGPLIATLALDFARAQRAEQQVEAYDFKMLNPVFLRPGAPCTLTLGGWTIDQDALGVEVRHGGRTCLKASVTFTPD